MKYADCFALKHSAVVFEQLVSDFAAIVLAVLSLAFFADFGLELADFEMHAVVAAAKKDEKIHGLIKILIANHLSK